MFLLRISISCCFRRKETDFWIKTNTLPSIFLKASWPTAARNKKILSNLRHHWLNPWCKPSWVLEPKNPFLGAFSRAEDTSSLVGMLLESDSDRDLGSDSDSGSGSDSRAEQALNFVLRSVFPHQKGSGWVKLNKWAQSRYSGSLISELQSALSCVEDFLISVSPALESGNDGMLSPDCRTDSSFLSLWHLEI